MSERFTREEFEEALARSVRILFGPEARVRFTAQSAVSMSTLRRAWDILENLEKYEDFP